MSRKLAAGGLQNHSGTPGRRMGWKVFPNSMIGMGSIIYRQRGTRINPWWHVKMGRDHTLYATADGQIRFFSRYGKKYVYVLPCR